ncbi:hypothetical protein Pcinc_030756 [Petrolisthes cinctipes]|uniref:Major facilitator superfamily (MFS) profile domain-containing protein n=1 Tax=Petrolisthes cinctipes TaxID=88211 RepID=A0AAE1EY32_PETCI|nr:hypothetical protein Pcinc_030756 [Petrolisthes cinctipes]
MSEKVVMSEKGDNHEGDRMSKKNTRGKDVDEGNYECEAANHNEAKQKHRGGGGGGGGGGGSEGEGEGGGGSEGEGEGGGGEGGGGGSEGEGGGGEGGGGGSEGEGGGGGGGGRGGGEGSVPDDLFWVTTFEDLLELVGTTGPWNVMIFFLCTYAIFVSPFMSMSYQFLGATPDHWCLVPVLVEANWTQQQILSIAIPYNNVTGEYDSCQMYDYDYTTVAEMGYEKAREGLLTPTNLTVSCWSRDFNYTQYQSTVVTEWDLVCERRALYSSTFSAAGFGGLFGAPISGFLLDRYGRRPVVLGSVLLLIVIGNLIVLSPSIVVYVVARGFIGILNTAVYNGAFAFVMESCAIKNRSLVGSMSVIPWALGLSCTPLIAYLVRTWRWLSFCLAFPVIFQLSYICVIPALLHMVSVIPALLHMVSVIPALLHMVSVIPAVLHMVVARVTKMANTKGTSQSGSHYPQESCQDEQEVTAPRHTHASGNETDYLSGKGRETTSIREQEGATSIREQEGATSIMEQEGATSIMDYIRSCMEQMGAPFLRPELRLRSLVLVVWLCGSFVYYGITLIATNIRTDTYVYLSLAGLLEIPSYLLLWPAIAYLGRRWSQVVSYLICGLCILVLMTLLLLLEHRNEGLILTVSLCGKIVITSVYQLTWIYTTELFPTEYRTLALGLGQALADLSIIITPFINDILGDVVVWAPSAAFGCLAVLASVVSMFLPETRHSAMPEVTSLTRSASISCPNKTMVVVVPLNQHDLTTVSLDSREYDKGLMVESFDVRGNDNTRI